MNMEVSISQPEPDKQQQQQQQQQASTDEQQKQASWWWEFLLRPIMELTVQCWPTTNPLLCLPEPPKTRHVTGTIICPVDSGKVRLYMQDDHSSSPLVLLNLPLDISEFARLVQLGMSRIVLECRRDHLRYRPDDALWPATVPRWTMYCNGHKVGFASRREEAEKDRAVLETLQTVTTGVGVLPEKEGSEGEFKYLRGQFEKVVASAHAQAYHLVDPFGCLGQDLSIFFLMH